MTIEIGIVKVLIGSATATSSDGTQRELRVGERLYANDIITTAAASAIEIEFADGSLMDLGRNSQVFLDSTLFDPQQPVGEEERDVDIAGLQEALIEGDDPTQTGEAPAAGQEIQDNEGTTAAVVVDYIAPVVDVTSGFDTGGVISPISREDNLFGGLDESIAASRQADLGDTGSPSTFTSVSIADRSDNDSDLINLAVANNFSTTSGPLLYSANGLPSGLTIDSQTGVISGVLDSSASQSGPYNVEIIATDSDGNSRSQSFVWNVINPAPEANDDNASLDEDTSYIGSVAGNDTDPDGDSLGFSLTSTVSNGSLVFNNDGSYTYTPNPDFNGTDSFTYTVTDADGATNTAIVNLVINPQDDATVTRSDTLTLNEDTITGVPGLFGVLSNDSDIDTNLTVSSFTIAGDTTTYPAGSEVMISGIGTFSLESNGAYSFSPESNYSGAVPVVTYMTNTGATNTLTLTVAPVADAPTLMMSVTSAAVSATTIQTIDVNNVTTTDNGFTVSAVSLDGTPGTISIDSTPSHAGFGVQGNASGAQQELGSTGSASESISVLFDNAVSSIDVSFAWLAVVEHAQYDFYMNGVQVGTGTIRGVTDRIDGPFTLTPGPGIVFDQVVFSAPLNPTDDYLINSISFEVPQTYTYEIDISAALTDVDGSETLSGITIAGLPTGTSIVTGANIDGTYNPGTVTLVSDHQLTSTELNTITGSVTATDGSSTATTTTNVKVNVDDNTIAIQNSTDTFLNGTAGDDVLVGLAGDDNIVGGSGNDILTGGDGNDMFVWSASDVGTAASPARDQITDFDVNNDVLNLADLLSDGSYTIEGITTGTGDLQLNIKDAGGNVVQEIELQGVSVTTTAPQLLDDLLNNGVINDGI